MRALLNKLEIRIEGSLQNYELDNSDKYLLHVLALNVHMKGFEIHIKFHAQGEVGGAFYTISSLKVVIGRVWGHHNHHQVL
jgi:hypothetical protein